MSARFIPIVRGLVVAAVAFTLTACGSNAGGPSNGSGKAAGGGTVRVGILGGQTDTLDVTKASSFLIYGVALNVQDSLVTIVDGQPKLQLAESITPNADATTWTIKIRDGVKFHNGKPLTADDALASLKYLSAGPNFGTLFADLDFTKASSDGKLTLTLPLKKPRADLIESVLAQISVVSPAGTTDFSKMIGSGPFKLQSYTPGSGAVLVRNDDYWGKPATLDRVEFIPIADSDARMSALTGNQIDYAMGVTPTGVETIPEGSGIVVQDPGAAQSNAFAFYMNSSKAPFDDPEVREAFRLAIDREALVKVVFRGKGTVGNDLVGKGIVGYNDTLPKRQRNLRKAKQVFAAKGVTELTAVTAEMTPGILDATKLLAQQLKEAGVALKINEADPTTLFNDLSTLKASNLFSFYSANRPFAAHASMFLVDGAPGNYFGANIPGLKETITKAQMETDEAKRRSLLNDAQKVSWESGWDAVWGYQPVLAARKQNLTGVNIALIIPVFSQASYQK